MVDYAKKTVAELQEILKSRSLPHTGKKAELVARLNEADQNTEENGMYPAQPRTRVTSQCFLFALRHLGQHSGILIIFYIEATKAPPAESTSAPPEQEPEPIPEPVAEAPATQEPLAEPLQPEATDSATVDTDAALAASASYALNLPGSDLDAEMAKRKARAERFGTGAAATNGEAGNTEADAADMEVQKVLDRAKRFGTGQTTVGKLDEALSAEPERGSRKRPRTEETSAMDDPGLRRGFAGRGRGASRGGRFRGRGGRDNSRRTGDKPAGIGKSGGVFSSDADRLAAEARKKKFATA